MKIVNNMGNADRAVRIVVGLAALYAFFAGMLSAPLSYLLLLIAVVLFATAAIGWCHLYTLLGISTLEKKQAAKKKK